MHALLLLALVGCDDSHLGEPLDDTRGADSANPSDAPTWHGDIAPIVQRSCASCHVEGGLAGFDLTEPDNAARFATAMAASVAAGRMPPWGTQPMDDCAPRLPFAGDLSLSDDEKALLEAWSAAGAPLGDPDAAAPLPDQPDLSLQGVNAVLDVVSGYTTSGPKDEYVCFSFDPGLEEDAWLTGTEVRPGDREVLHHALIYLDEGGLSEGLAGEDGWYPCFGGPGIGATDLLATYVPGAAPVEAPDGTGMRIPAGSRLVMATHYHPADEPRTDVSQLALRFAEQRPDRTFHMALLGNFRTEAAGLAPGPHDDGDPRFFIPAGAGDHTETMVYEVPRGAPELPITQIGNHMHYVGSGGTIRVLRDDGDPQGDECLLAEPTWDIDWQRTYVYDAPVADVPTVSGGDRIEITCHYDNTMDHPGTAALVEDAGLDGPVDVTLGEETLDEMCLGIVGFVY